MFVKKNFSLRQILQFSGHHLLWLIPWMTSVAIAYEIFDLSWLRIPWLPLAVIGTAVAFYVGFKNNSAYGRMWEARKIWGRLSTAAVPGAVR
ncbi:MAG: bestrophin family ion channel [Bacteroidota bacterium]